MPEKAITATKIGTQYKLVANTIGTLFIHFGIIEFKTFDWIKELSKDKAVHYLMDGAKLSQRLILINKLIEWSDWKREDKRKAQDLWKDISKISETRNAVAHNPILMLPENGKLVCKVMKRIKKKDITVTKLEFISLEDIEAETVRLGELIEDLCVLLHK